MKAGSVLFSTSTLCGAALLISLFAVAASAGTTGPVAGLRLNGASGDYFGSSMARIGDVNGDGTADFIVGMPDTSGKARVFSGADWSVIRTHEETYMYGSMGISVAAAGDVNADGRADYLVGARGKHGPGPDMYPEGGVYLFSGMDGSMVRMFWGRAAHDFFGHSVAAVGDLTGDGISEVLIGAPQDTYMSGRPGYAQLFNGATGTSLHIFEGTSNSDCFGWSVAGVGDVNGDGTPDLLIGACQADPGGMTDAGSAFLYSGADYSLLHQWDGEAADDRLGYAVAGIEDVNGDTFPDLLIGAWYADPGGRTNAGSAYLYSGADYSLIHRFDGETAADWFGCSVADAGDVDGDGTHDILIGAYYAPRYATPMCGGRAYLYSGDGFSLIRRWDGYEVDGYLGWAVAPAGDANGDGKLDVMLGAPYVNSVFIVTACCAPMVINSDEASTSTTDVDVQNTVFGAAQMRFKNDGSDWSAWEPYATSKSWTLPSGDGVKRIYAQFKDLLGTDSAEVYDEITLAAPPTADTISISSGAACTNVADVLLTIAATNASEMRFRNETAAWSAWEPYATSKNWALSTGRGLKTVGFQVRNIASQESSIITDTIRIPTFQDVTCLHSAWAYIEAFVRQGITSGCSASPPRYCPTANVTRAQMAVFLCKAAGKLPLNRDTPTFADVPKAHPAYGYVERLAYAPSWPAGAPTGGCRIVGTTKYFCPGDSVTREQMAKFLCVAAGKAPMPTCSGTFADAGSGNSFCRYIERLTDGPSWPGGVAVTSGCACPAGYPQGAKCYCPKDNVTRAQMAVFIVKAFGISL